MTMTIDQPLDASATTTGKMSKATFSLTIRAKIILLLLIFGVIPAGGMLGIFQYQSEGFHAKLSESLAVEASKLVDVIDRNLFERYGDVQAFGLNTAAQTPANWNNPSAENPLVRAMNGYMTGYGIYKLMVMVDLSGKALAVNTVDGSGNPIQSDAVYGHSFANAKWFQETSQGRFLEGENGLTGTYVEPPQINSFLSDVYGVQEFTMVFSAPVHDSDGNVVAIWANYVDFATVEDIVSAFYDGFAIAGQSNAELTLMDASGVILVDWDPKGQNWETYPRNHEVIGNVNLVKLGVNAAIAAVESTPGLPGSIAFSHHARKGLDQAAGYARSNGAYDYPGLGWTALVRVPVGEAYALWDTTILELLIALAVTVGVVIVAGAFIGRMFSSPITQMTLAMQQLAAGDTTGHIPAVGRGDEIGKMAATVVIFRDNKVESDHQAEEQRQMREEQDRMAEEQRAAETIKRERADRMETSVREFEIKASELIASVADAATRIEHSSQASGVGEFFALAFLGFHRNISFRFQAARHSLLMVFAHCKGMVGLILN